MKEIGKDDLYSSLIDSINSLREQIQSDTKGSFSREDYRILQEALTPFMCFKTVEIFLNDCKNSIGGPYNFSNTRDYVFKKEEPLVLSFFNAPYNKAFGLDAFFYNVVEAEEHFRKKYKDSMATSINIVKCSRGFDQYPTCVALFPENFCSTESFKDKFSVFYFVNVFERRFQEYGTPTLNSYVHQKTFWRLKRLSKNARDKAFSTWHYLHEYFHSTGPLPLIDFLSIKSKKKTAAIEESRVDVLSILECLNSAETGFSDGFFYAELILFERMVRYSVHLEPEFNYDARASHILFGFLKEQGAISTDNMILDIDKLALKNALTKYVLKIQELELNIREALSENQPIAVSTAIEALINFADNYTNKGLVLKNEYFKNIEENLKFTIS